MSKFLTFKEITLKDLGDGVDDIKTEMLPVLLKKNLIVDNKKGERLGWINFYPKWQKYVFTVNHFVILDSDCMKAITITLEALNENN